MPRSALNRKKWLLTSLLAISSIAAVAYAAGPPLHEFVPSDAEEDLLLGNTTSAGDLPAALKTPSGVVTAPDPLRSPKPSDKAYGRTNAPENSQFQPDRDTRAVDQVDYDDPFSPSLTPFKRLSSFDAVDASYALRVADSSPRAVPVGGTVQPGEDPFYGDMTVDLVAGELVRIPTPGPGTRILKLHTTPQVAVEVVRDSADNYFLRGAVRARVHLMMHLSAPRNSLGGPLRDAAWFDIAQPAALPAPVQTAANEVNRRIGVSRSQTFREVVSRLVSYYRAFEPTDEPLPTGGDIFVDIATSKKGICRHRSFAFVVSALALRIPARLVTNEAHAWVEVHDGQLWHRIDLGGAAINFNDTTSDDRVPHSPPPDPFPWPEGSSPGQESADRTRRLSQAGDAAPSGSAAPGASSAAPQQGSTQQPTDQSDPQGSDGRPSTEIRLTRFENEVFRNQPIHLEGVARSNDGACPFVRVDVVLASHGAEQTIGSLATDEGGHFAGAVVIPASSSVGDYELVLTTPGDARCGKGRSSETP